VNPRNVLAANRNRTHYLTITMARPTRHHRTRQGQARPSRAAADAALASRLALPSAIVRRRRAIRPRSGHRERGSRDEEGEESQEGQEGINGKPARKTARTTGAKKKAHPKGARSEKSLRGGCKVCRGIRLPTTPQVPGDTKRCLMSSRLHGEYIRRRRKAVDCSECKYCSSDSLGEIPNHKTFFAQLLFCAGTGRDTARFLLEYFEEK